MSKQSTKKRLLELMTDPIETEKLIHVCMDDSKPENSNGRPVIVFRDFSKENCK